MHSINFLCIFVGAGKTRYLRGPFSSERVKQGTSEVGGETRYPGRDTLEVSRQQDTLEVPPALAQFAVNAKT